MILIYDVIERISSHKIVLCMQFYSNFLFDPLRSDINYEIDVIDDCFVKISSVNVVEKNLVPKSQTKPFYIGTKEAPSV